jgi:hypothetical protein
VVDLNAAAMTEIDPPPGAARSFKEFAIQLVTITAGVLIALSIEGVREWSHYRALVREARETIAREIADNKKELDGRLKAFDSVKKNLDTAFQLVNELLATKKSDINRLELGFEMAELSAASWQTAERTGALAHMDYAEVQRLSRLYDAQSLYLEHQRRTLERLAAAVTLFAGGDPHTAPAKDLETFRAHVLELQGGYAIQAQLGQRLTELYERSLRE